MRPGVEFLFAESPKYPEMLAKVIIKGLGIYSKQKVVKELVLSFAILSRVSRVAQVSGSLRDFLQ
jgi:hypothetical protein